MFRRPLYSPRGGPQITPKYVGRRGVPTYGDMAEDAPEEADALISLIRMPVVSVMFALDHRRELAGAWGWMLASGIVDLVLATIILAGLPGTAAWAIGLLVGINLTFGGVALVAMALQARKIDPTLATGG